MILKVLPKKSERWIEHAYMAFNEGVLTEKTPLNVAILKLLPGMIDDDVLKENFLRVKAPAL